MRSVIELLREFVRIANASQTTSDPAEVLREQARLGQLFLEAEELVKAIDSGQVGEMS